jgi:hypothetical protein
MFTADCTVTAGAPVVATTMPDVVVHPFASVTVTEYDPPARLTAVAVVCEFVHAYVYGPVPPLASASAVPLLFPQVAGVDAGADSNGVGSVIVTAWIVKQLFASVTETE